MDTPRLTLAELASRLDCELHGDGSASVGRLAPLDSAGPDDLAFVVDASWRDRLAASLAGAVIVPPELANTAPGAHLVSQDPYASFASASWLFAPDDDIAAGRHESAVVDATATIADTSIIGAGVVIGAATTIGDDVRVDAGCVIGRDCAIGAGTRLFARVVIGDAVTMGRSCRVQSGAVVGSEGFGYARTSQGWQAIRQAGGVSIGNRVHIGANTTIDGGAIEPTILADGVILDNQIQIAHNVRIGENTAIAGCTGIAGSTVIGRDCLIGGACNIVGHIEIADGVILNAASLVVRSIDEPGRYGSGSPLQPERRWRRTFAAIGKLDELVRRVRRLEQQATVPVDDGKA